MRGDIQEIDAVEYLCVQHPDRHAIFIVWDSITLREMGLDLVIRCEKENLDWQVMTLNKREIEKTSNRDFEHDVVLVADALRTEMMNDPRLDAESGT